MGKKIKKVIEIIMKKLNKYKDRKHWRRLNKRNAKKWENAAIKLIKKKKFIKKTSKVTAGKKQAKKMTLKVKLKAQTKQQTNRKYYQDSEETKQTTTTKILSSSRATAIQ